MEKNIEVKVIDSYHDLELGKDIDLGKKMWLTEKRARQLLNLNLVKILQIKKLQK